MIKVFLSHSSKDKSFARKLSKLLKDNQVSVWLDEAELKVGDSLLFRISDAISENDFVIAIISKNSAASHWVQKELALAMNYEITKKKVKVLPVIIDECEIPSFLVDKLYLDFRNQDDFGEPFDRLLHSIGLTQAHINNPRFTNIRFCSKDSFDEKSNECTKSEPTFQSPIELIYASWSAKNVYRGMHFSRSWYKDGILWLTKDDVWDEIWDENIPASTFVLNKHDHPEGKYTLRLYIEDIYMCSGNFLIE